MKRRGIDYSLTTNLTMGQGLDLMQDFLHAFGADVREACQHVPPVFHNKKSATVTPLRRPVPVSQHSKEVPSCLSDISPKPISEN